MVVVGIVVVEMLSTGLDRATKVDAREAVGAPWWLRLEISTTDYTVYSYTYFLVSFVRCT
jgi:hypothetical protein